MDLARLGIQIDSSGVKEANRNLNELPKSGKKAETGIDRLEKRFDKLNKHLEKTSKFFNKYFTLPIAAAGVAGVKFASDFEESMNKIDVAFQDSQNIVLDWSKNTSDLYGISSGAALDAAATFGDMATSMGISRDLAAVMSKEIVGLSGDMASFKNIRQDVASNALKGIFTGEGEALKTQGIIMQENTLAAFALAEGYEETYKEMSQAEKVMLRYEYVLDATKNAQGDFSRTSDSLANMLRSVQANLKDTAVVFGEELLPIVKPAVKHLLDLVKGFADLDDGTKRIILGLAGTAAAIGPTMKLISALTKSVGGLNTAVKFLSANPLIAALGITAAGVGAVALVVNQLHGEQKKFEENLKNNKIKTEDLLKDYAELQKLEILSPQQSQQMNDTFDKLASKISVFGEYSDEIIDLVHATEDYAGALKILNDVEKLVSERDSLGGALDDRTKNYIKVRDELLEAKSQADRASVFWRNSYFLNEEKYSANMISAWERDGQFALDTFNGYVEKFTGGIEKAKTSYDTEIAELLKIPDDLIKVTAPPEENIKRWQEHVKEIAGITEDAMIQNRDKYGGLGAAAANLFIEKLQAEFENQDIADTIGIDLTSSYQSQMDAIRDVMESFFKIDPSEINEPFKTNDSIILTLTNRYKGLAAAIEVLEAEKDPIKENEYLAGLIDEANALTMSKEAYQRYMAEKSGLKGIDIETYIALWEEVEAIKAHTIELNKNETAIKNIKDALIEQEEAFGLTERGLLERTLGKYTQDQKVINEILELFDKVEELNKKSSLEDYAAGIKDSLITKEEKHTEAIKKANEALLANLLTQEEYNLHLKNLEEQYREVDTEAERLAKAVEDQIAALQKQEVTFGKTTREMLIYNLTQNQATNEQIRQALAIQGHIDALGARQKAEENYLNFKQTYKDKAQKIIDSLLTEEEKYAEALKELNILHNLKIDGEFLLTDSQFEKAVEKLKEQYGLLEELTEKDIFKDLGKSLLDIGKTEALNGLREVGELLADISLYGDQASKSFEATLESIKRSILRALPNLLLNAGLQIIGTNLPVGLALIGASGLVAIRSGYEDYKASEKQKSVTKNEHGNVFYNGSIVAHSKGDVIDTIKYFQMTNGIGSMAEKAPEAIMPLKRLSNGNLGVESTGAATAVQLNIKVINNTNAEVTTEEKPNGNPNIKDIEIVIGNTVKKQMGNGTYDKDFNLNYGLKRKGISG